MAKLVRQLNTEHVLIDSATAPLLARMRASLSAALGRPIEDGDPELIAAASLLPYFGQGLAAADIASKAMLLQFATGDDLEAIGAHYGIARRTLHATMDVKLIVYVTAGTYAVSITGEAPDGTLFSHINDAWTLLADTEHPEFTLTCEATGDTYNGLNELINPVFLITPSGEAAVDYGSLLEVLSASRGGGPETDDVYASRIHDTLLARMGAGSTAGLEAWARTLEGVMDCFVFDGSFELGPDPDPAVTVVYISDAVTEEGMKTHMHANTAAPLGIPPYLAIKAIPFDTGSIEYSYYVPASADDPDALIASIAAAGEAWAASISFRFSGSWDTSAGVVRRGIFDPTAGFEVLLGAGAWGVECNQSPVDLDDPLAGFAGLFSMLTYPVPEAFTFTCKGVSNWI